MTQVFVNVTLGNRQKLKVISAAQILLFAYWLTDIELAETSIFCGWIRSLFLQTSFLLDTIIYIALVPEFTAKFDNYCLHYCWAGRIGYFKNNDCARPPVLVVRNETMQIAVLEHIIMIQHWFLKDHRIYPYKIKLLHKLNEVDYGRRLQFVEEISERCIGLSHIISAFQIPFLHWLVSLHNCRYWSDLSPDLIRECHTQVPEKLNVRASILGNNGTILFKIYLAVQKYLALLQENIIPRIKEDIAEDNNLTQEGAPPHYATTVTFRRIFQWIGRRGSTPRYPDLFHLTSFFEAIWSVPFIRRLFFKSCKI